MALILPRLRLSGRPAYKTARPRSDLYRGPGHSGRAERWEVEFVELAQLWLRGSHTHYYFHPARRKRTLWPQLTRFASVLILTTRSSPTTRRSSGSLSSKD